MASSKDAVVLDVGGHEVRVSNPEKPYFAEKGIRKIDVVEYFVAVGEGILFALQGPADDAGALARRGVRGRPAVHPDGQHRRRVLPEAGAQERPRVGADGAHHLPQRADRGRDRAGLRRRRRLVRQPRHADLPPVAGGQGRRRVAEPDPHRPRPAAGHRLLRRRVGGPARPRAAARVRHGGLAEDLRRPRRAHLRADPAAVDVHRRAPGGHRLRPRAGTAAPRPRDDVVVEGGARREDLHRLQPDGPGPHDRLGVLDPAQAARPRLGAAWTGTSCPTSPRSTSTS